ncbi:class I SAM-dependent methyltransferase [Nocardiopsis lambiniae]|uniref:Class I SAM-dependent methyltransferase n=1 Tax=Nocardiopsis lambiniae TaxID=3075539 RepID=A0ABU2MBQ9_9ACTN|nr:class I SAM-dependent methyltransferase [Nocardiopsis sp. DSM 44743]MDT0330122.1 class I SAM-dependent methyltransferase [Nocardiopsis sp. DSM 44743]
MNTVETEEFAPEWLAAREGVDALARSHGPLPVLAEHHRVVADLGCGTGSLGRWTAARAPGVERWLLFDRDPRLLALAADRVPGRVETRLVELARLRAADLTGVTLVAASALLDLLTAEEVRAVTDAVASTGCPAWFTLSVAGRVALTPEDPLDGAVTAAFNAHQRRAQRLGPDAIDATIDAFARRGYRATTFPSPWRLGPDHPEVTGMWLRGWAGAAAEQAPDLPVADYLRRRLAALEQGRLTAVVHHDDLLLMPPEPGDRP